MPKSCTFCRFCEGLADTLNGTCAFCAVDGKQRDAQTNDGCPLIPVPEHGRLIDAEEFKTHFWEKQAYFTERIYQKLDMMPTIIPADKEGDNG